jgi:superfamily I DNA and/or RNA helicase/very-short-patch-repair endonuclease/predicted RNA-binding Zn-ribbon protein involved in translation (DUF1610 family)
MSITPETQEVKSLDFIRDVAKYFMDFLETDFHKRKLPKRSVKFRNNDNLLIGLNLQKYGSFNQKVFKFIQGGFDKDIPTGIEKGVFKTDLPKNLLSLIKLRIEKISTASVTETVERIASEIDNAGSLHSDEYDVALTKSVEAASQIIKNDLVAPFISQIEKPLQNLELGDEENVYLVEEELTGVLVKLLESKISETLNSTIAKNKINVVKELKSVFEPTDVRASILCFFDSLQVADLYAEIFELDRNKGILDKQEFYLYFGDISYESVKYPLFYIPFSLNRQGDVFNIEFDSQVYINKKAIEFIVQEYNVKTGKKGNLKTVSERIIYISQEKGRLLEDLNKVLNELLNFFELKGSVDFSGNEYGVAKSQLVRVSNNFYISLFDKSDEALVNDYEEILQQLTQEEGPLADIFKLLIGDFIHNNPQPFNPEVEEEWDGASTSERLVPSSPIPLNSEQLQILSAIRKDGCKYIIVEGPPGTGKSHTITAIIFDAILSNKSVLVLSDKKEALDVVEDKITQTMNKVRFDKNFQNPILRLGKTGSTYGSILAKSAIESIKMHLRATKKDYETIETNIDKLSNTLKEDVEAEIVAYNNVSIQEIHELFDLENHLEQGQQIIDVDEAVLQPDALVELGELKDTLGSVNKTLGSKDYEAIFSTFNKGWNDFTRAEELKEFADRLVVIRDIVEKLKTGHPAKIDSFKLFNRFKTDNVKQLQEFIAECAKLKSWLFGYAFSKKRLADLDKQFADTFEQTEIFKAHEHLTELQGILDVCTSAQQLLAQVDAEVLGVNDHIATVHHLLTRRELAENFNAIIELNNDLSYLAELSGRYPNTIAKIEIDIGDLRTLKENKLESINSLEFDKTLRYISLKQKLSNDFSKIPELNFAKRKENLEELVTARVTYMLDGRLINFYEHNRSDAETLRNIIRNKQCFPKEEFAKLKEAFPCILAGIRDYAEYIPLEPQIFDLVIIDEASQVSVAQAFPALLRAKKVLILGDKKQFSNIKAAQARGDTNREYLNNLSRSFTENVSKEKTKIVRLGKFNIKTSILEFFEFISNYNIQLLKHFRGYKEIISYSNKFFYQESLQVMKIRSRQINEVIKFSFVKADEKEEMYQNTNLNEVEFIIERLQEIKKEGREPSVGLITPHTNQQKLLTEKIYKLADRDYFFEKLNLKIMTFDTCQGEERDIIFYSMVASEHSDKLWGVFIKDLNSVDLEEDGQIKAQRLNVGFSRAKECMHFVLSKPLDEFSGSIGDALRHYHFVLEEAKQERSVAETDSNSKMEPEVLNWFYQTKFWKENKDSIEFLPQFEIGKYLKQLDRTYTHPAYVVDFLLIYTDESHREHKIIIEYDGFREHFKDIDGVNEFNYKEYYSDGDVYRQKVLESYGYKFLRINKFNIGANAIENLDKRISALIRLATGGNPLLTNIHETIEGLQTGEMKECPKCKEVRDIQDFKDSSLSTGVGRFCGVCKGMKMKPETLKAAPVLSDENCPRCGKKMILRDGRRGKFYGCSRFPYCKGTRNHS